VRTYIIHIADNPQSVKTANLALETSYDYGYDAKLFEGITPKTLATHDTKWGLTVMRPSHMYDRQIGLNGSRYTYECKYSNFLNHYTIWQSVVAAEETTIVLEHDVIAVRPWDNPDFDEMLVLNMDCGLHEKQFNRILKPKLYEGVHRYENPYLIYRSENRWKGAGMIPGSAAYAITPKGAQRLIDNVNRYGWDKADYIINNKAVKMEYAHPDYFIFSHHIVPNQRTSHGE
jgi:GR25 family glycosyltransferase involved in LPS biosynthesis